MNGKELTRKYWMPTLGALLIIGSLDGGNGLGFFLGVYFILSYLAKIDKLGGFGEKVNALNDHLTGWWGKFGKGRKSSGSSSFNDGETELEQTCNRMLRSFWCSDRVASTVSSEWGYAMFREHKITRIDLYPYTAMRLNLTSRNLVVKMDHCSLAEAKAKATGETPKDDGSVSYRVETCPNCHGEKTVVCPDCHNEKPTWPCEDCHGEAGHTHTCPECEGEGEVECPDCHGKEEIDCPKCHGTGAADCPECEGTGRIRCSMCEGKGTHQTYRRVPCHLCHGSGETFFNGNRGTCSSCRGEGYEMEACEEPCATCDGKGYKECYHCHGKGKIWCEDCRGKGHTPCPTCHKTGTITCPECDGKGKLKCPKCDSTGTAYCHTCKGKGRISCPTCNGLGERGYTRSAKREDKEHMRVAIWSEKPIPKALVPTVFPTSPRENTCTSVYHASSEKETPDEALVTAETAAKFPQLKVAYDEVVRKLLTKERDHLVKQEAEIVNVNGLARLEIQCSGKDYGGVSWSGRKVICWLNLATRELLDIYESTQKSDDWYENHSLYDAMESPYALIDRAKRRDKEEAARLVRVAAALGNPVAKAWDSAQ